MAGNLTSNQYTKSVRISWYAFFCLLFISIQATAQIYKWVDSNGNVHYGDAKNTPGTAATSQVELGKTNTITSVTYDTVSSTESGVIMYSASWCGYCKQARRYFTANGIAFTEYDIEKNRAAAARHKKMGGVGVPVILFKDRRMNGFSEAGFKQIYRDGV